MDIDFSKNDQLKNLKSSLVYGDDTPSIITRMQEAFFSNQFNLIFLVVKREKDQQSTENYIESILNNKINNGTLLDWQNINNEVFNTGNIIKNILIQSIDMELDESKEFSLLNTFVLRSGSKISIPKIEAISREISSFGISMPIISYGVPIYDNKNKLSILIDRELNMLNTILSLSGMPINKSDKQLFLQALRGDAFYKNYCMFIITGFYGLSAIANNLFIGYSKKEKNNSIITPAFLFSDVRLTPTNINLSLDYSSNDKPWTLDVDFVYRKLNVLKSEYKF